MLTTVPDLHGIIEKRSILTHFQPQVSLKRKAVIGLEALSRGFDPQSGEIVPPTLLFGQARDGHHGSPLTGSAELRQWNPCSASSAVTGPLCSP